MSDAARLRRLAETVEDGAGQLYGLDWKSIQLSDEFGVSPRVLLGGPFSTVIRIGCWRPDQAPAIQSVADYLAALTPATVLELLDLAEGKYVESNRDQK
jgi:hypothetical protein